MKIGTWQVSGKIKKIETPLELVLIEQEKVLRAVPLSLVKGNRDIIKIIPGKITKEEKIIQLLKKLGNKYSKEEIISALPSGGFS